MAVDFDRIFGASEKVLTAKLDAIRSAFHHAGMRGSAVEEEIRSLLREYLPANLSIGSGIVIDSDLQDSKQIDIVIYDAAKTPEILSIGGQSIFPVECVYFCIEVKTFLNKGEFDKCVANMDSVKHLNRSAYYNDLGPISNSLNLYSGRVTEHWETMYFVFALEANGAPSVTEWLNEHRDSKREFHKQIDAMYIANLGSFHNIELIPPRSKKASILPSATSLIEHLEKDALTMFMALFSIYYNQAEMNKKFNFTHYLQLETSINIGHSERNQRLLRAAQENGFEVNQTFESRKSRPLTQNRQEE